MVVIMKSNKTLYITHPQFNFSEVNRNSILLTDVADLLSSNEYHTSLGDMSAEDIIATSAKFNSVCYVSDNFNESTDIFNETFILLSYLSHRHNIVNFNVPQINTFIDDSEIYNRVDTPVLWIFGCSHSHGVGLKSNEQRYSNIVGKTLNLPVKSITKPGSSTRWAFRHLINSNIKPNDIVIWQITTPDRISAYDSTVNEIMLSRTTNKFLLEVFSDQQLYFDQLSLINYGVNYLRAKNVPFVLTAIEKDSTLFYNYKKEYVKYKEFCYSPNFNVDIGDDGIHFGPLSHKNLALSLTNHIKYTYGKSI